MSRAKSSAVVVSGTVALVAMGGVAFAYQADAGVGDPGDIRAVAANQTSIVTGPAPGSGRQPLSGNLDNLSSGQAYVPAVRAEVVEVNDAAGNPTPG